MKPNPKSYRREIHTTFSPPLPSSTPPRQNITSYTLAKISLLQLIGVGLYQLTEPLVQFGVDGRLWISRVGAEENWQAVSMFPFDYFPYPKMWEESWLLIFGLLLEQVLGSF